jgi:hypothetical protein
MLLKSRTKFDTPTELNEIVKCTGENIAAQVQTNIKDSIKGTLRKSCSEKTRSGIVEECDSVFAVEDKRGVSHNHMLVIPFRHTEDFFQ